MVTQEIIGQNPGLSVSFFRHFLTSSERNSFFFFLQITVGHHKEKGILEVHNTYAT